LLHPIFQENKVLCEQKKVEKLEVETQRKVVNLDLEIQGTIVKRIHDNFESIQSKIL
jgi:hypothetical protein